MVVGARQHNLKGISVRLPKGKLITFIGPSGSGKTSLAFDTIYAEGERRYVESMDIRARQFLELLPRPDVERIEGLSPAIALPQRPLSRSPRSTVGTVTECSDFLRLLFSRGGTPHCPICGRPIEAQTVVQMVDRMLALPEGTKLTLLAPIARHRKGELRLELDRLRKDGFIRARIDGVQVDLGDELVPDKTKAHDLDVVVDRVVVRPSARQRISESTELALSLGEGAILAEVEGSEPLYFSENYSCTTCNRSIPALEPRLFSFNHPVGACPTCNGLGTKETVDESRVVSDASLSLREGVILPWGPRGSVAYAVEVARAVESLGIDPDKPWKTLPLVEKERLLSGAKAGKGKKQLEYEGVFRFVLDRVEGSGDSEPAEGTLGARELGAFLSEEVCPSCKGKRLSSDALSVTFRKTNIADLSELPLTALRDFFATADETELVRSIATPLRARLQFLLDVGLPYLSLSRTTATLSMGEAQRIRLANQLGSDLSGVLYVLDEPTVGLHPRDQERLVVAEKRLRDLGNTLIVVEHQRDAILACDHVVELGPAAGAGGGTILAEGSPADLILSGAPSAGFLRGDTHPGFGRGRRAPGRGRITLRGARLHNLKSVTLEIPVGLFVSVTGVSGSGKSSLIMHSLLPSVRAALRGGAAVHAEAIEGLAHVDQLVALDQDPIGRTPRSNPASYSGILAELRDIFAGLPESRARGYKPGRFSFNTKGGRCEACKGDGVRRVEMQFLPDVYLECEECRGKRYNRETLEVEFRGHSIADVLAMSVSAAADIFEAVPKIRDRLRALLDVGLGYLALGQPSNTLSGGEAQRLKLARELSKRATGRTLYVLDEPTAGLHFSDVEMLLRALFALRDQGNTILVVEHHLDVMAASDWIIDLGPEAGAGGARSSPKESPKTSPRRTQDSPRTTLRSVSPQWHRVDDDPRTRCQTS